MKSRFAFTILFTSLLCCAVHAQEQISGVGLILKADDQSIKVEGALPNSPAGRAHLTAGLLVQKIDGTETSDIKLKQAVDMIRGEAGTKVKLELVEPVHHETNTVELVREKISLPSGADAP